MVTIQQIERGAAVFVDREMSAKMPKLSGILLAAFAPLGIKAKIQEYAPLVSAMGLADGDAVDLDAMYAAFKEKAQGKWPIEILGFKASEEDLDKLYRYIREA